MNEGTEHEASVQTFAAGGEYVTPTPLNELPVTVTVHGTGGSQQALGTFAAPEGGWQLGAGGGGGGANVPAAPERTEPYYRGHPDGPIPVDLGQNVPDEQPDGESWILTAAGNVLLCSSIGARQSLESVAGTSGYFDSLDVNEATPEQRAAIFAGIRAWLDRQDATDGA